MVNYAVLGLGLMGSALSYDLLTHDPTSQVIGFDKDPLQREKQKNKLNNFKNRFHVKPLDLNQENRQNLEQILKENAISVVFGAIDYRFNYMLSQTCIKAEC
ncbi:MAG: saccharopine dehydrogenase NADP-binding domain-containing protein, partial [Candidatus Hodarchaeales archaeon]